MELSKLVNYKSNASRLGEIKKNRRDIIPFVGAGVSKGCGLYTWGELLNKIAVEFLTDVEIKSLEDEKDFFKYADQIVEAAGNSDMVMRRIREIFSQANIIPSEVPKLLVSGFSDMVVTTNYDKLLEEASVGSHRGPLKPLLPCLIGQVHESIQINNRSLLKIHGSLEEVTSFVFHTEQYRMAYGNAANRDGCLVPLYLTKIFSSKKVLFVGCSLEKDYTLDILEECVQNTRGISHYAIVPAYADPDKFILRNRELTRLGIEPIYYPEGDFNAVNQLVNYLAEENKLVTSVEAILENTVEDHAEKQFQIDILISLLKECFYKTAVKYPDILDIDNLKESFTQDIWDTVGIKRSQDDTLFDLCKTAFSAYIRAGGMLYEKEIIAFFEDQFADKVLKETSIEKLVKKQWSIIQNIPWNSSENVGWIEKLNENEIDQYAEDLAEKLRFQNGMSFAVIKPYYDMTKQFVEIAEDRLSFPVKIKLLNNLGAMGHYFKDAAKSIHYLEKCIQYIDANGNKERELMLFKAKCYANLAIAKSLHSYDINSVLEISRNDIMLKKEYHESEKLYARSLNFYATALKEIDIIKACDAYLEAVEIKYRLVVNEKDNDQVRELIASWATTVFNLGLLAKDLELYEVAYRLVRVANEYRFKTVDYQNRDYCSSLNVRAELELFVHEKNNLHFLIDGVESRVDLPIGFSGTLAHSWYICSYYYFKNKNFITAKVYAQKALAESNKKGTLVDFQQEIRIRILLGEIKLAQAKNEKDIDLVVKIFEEIINDIIVLYGMDSFFLLKPYKCMINAVKDDYIMNEYRNKYRILDDMYRQKIREVETRLDKFVEGCPTSFDMICRDRSEK